LDFSEYIAQWRKELLSPSKDDVLVNVIDSRNALLLEEWNSAGDQQLLIEDNKLSRKLIKTSQIAFKKSAVQTLGITNGTIQYSFEGNDFLSPLIIENVHAKIDRIRKKIAIQKSGNSFVNPFLEKQFGIQCSEVSVDSILKELEGKGLRYTFHRKSYLGNFHPHRFILLRDIEQLSEQEELNFALNELFGNVENNHFSLSLSDQQIVFTDECQKEAVEQLKDRNTVLQGPPGTGKSDVIANAITKSMASGHTTLLIAEQQTAINVVVDKLKRHNLHHFCARMHHNLSAKDFVNDLKKAWLFLEQMESNFSAEINRSYHMLQNLQLLLNKLNAKALYGGIGYGDFKKYCEQFNARSIQVPSSFPEIQNWLNEKDQLSTCLSRFRNDQYFMWTFLKIEEKDNAQMLEKDIQKAKQLIQRIGHEKTFIHEFNELSRLTNYVHLFFYNDRLLDRKLFDASKSKAKKFKKLFGELLQVNDEIEIYKNEESNWEKEMNESELFDFLQVVQSKDKFSLTNWMKKRELRKASKFDLKGVKKAIENLLYFKELQKKKAKIKADFRKLDLPDDSQSLNQINLLIQKTRNIKPNVLQELNDLPENELRELYLNAQETQEIGQILNRHFLFLPRLNWVDFFDQYSRLKADLKGSTEELSTISLPAKQMVYECKELEVLHYDAIVFQTHWRYLSAKFPKLTSFDPSQLGEKLDAIISQSKQDQASFAQQIKNTVKTEFDKAHQLLLIPARKLSDEDKERKVRLRKGKSILVKQFAKSRNHLSPLELLSSDAAAWIQILKPLISGSSVSVAQNLPFEKEYFDLALFDEASQINLSHAVGSIFRAKRVLVAGDSQQMPPSHLFNASNRGIDLLSQASYYWKNIHLEYHYRSHHPELITFSNTHFYNDKLRAFPFFEAHFPIEVINLMGVYHDRINELEADKAAEIITEKVNQHNFDFGIVAFSQKQLDFILSRLDANTLSQVQEREHMLLISSLEHVQGEQCDHLIISLGYGKNEEGKFSHQFGPLNKSGGHRRLNVLMSRARKKITFIRSVNELDFKISENDGVDMLRKLMVYLSDVSSKVAEREVQTKETNKYCIPSFYENIPEANNLISIHHVLTERGWEVEYTF
jgi:hypothetical protein